MVRQQISENKKDQICTQLLAGNTVSELSKIHNIGTSTLYKWQRKIRQQQNNNNNVGEELYFTNHEQFVELSMSTASTSQDNKALLPKNQIFKQISLNLNSFELSISGKISNENLLQILQLLEEL